MRILVFGGTADGRILAESLCKMNIDITVSVATALGAEQLKNLDCHILCGRMTLEEIKQTITAYDVIIDATHPYAAVVTANIKSACDECNKTLYRLLRSGSSVDDYTIFDSCTSAAEHLIETEGNILLTTGSKELSAFSKINPERLYPRVLPVTDGIRACESLNIPHRNIIAMQGPFTEEMNEALINQFNIKHMVTKDGGAHGGFAEKIKAAEKNNVKIIIIKRPDDRGMSPEQILREVKKIAD